MQKPQSSQMLKFSTNVSKLEVTVLFSLKCRTNLMCSAGMFQLMARSCAKSLQLLLEALEEESGQPVPWEPTFPRHSSG